jgi:hypothetical protein
MILNFFGDVPMFERRALERMIDKFDERKKPRTMPGLLT